MKEIIKKIASNSQKALLTSSYNKVKPTVSNKKTVPTNKHSHPEE